MAPESSSDKTGRKEKGQTLAGENLPLVYYVLSGSLRRRGREIRLGEGRGDETCLRNSTGAREPSIDAHVRIPFNA